MRASGSDNDLSVRIAGVHAHPAFAGGVPGVAPDLIQCVTGPSDDVERISAPDRVRAVRGDLLGDPLRGIGRDVSDYGAAGFAQGGTERAQGLAVPSGSGPDQQGEAQSRFGWS